jgi:hypothetical protein
MGACEIQDNYYKGDCLENVSNNNVKPVMAIAEAHANVTSPHGHGGFDFVYQN